MGIPGKFLSFFWNPEESLESLGNSWGGDPWGKLGFRASWNSSRDPSLEPYEIPGKRAAANGHRALARLCWVPYLLVQIWKRSLGPRGTWLTNLETWKHEAIP